MPDPAIHRTETVSIIIPCLNEETTIQGVLEAICQQTYPLNCIEVLIADGLSQDGTRAGILLFQQKHPEINIKVLDNPKKAIPSGLNLAANAASGSILLRLDAHCCPEPDYVARSVAGLQLGRGQNVGGLWIIKPSGDSWVSRSIALAAAHPFAVGDAKYRYSQEAGPVDTVPFGCFYRKYWQDLGGYDEGLQSNEDYELNTRIRNAGGVVWFDPDIRSVYYSRATWRELAQQYWRYGYWKIRMLRKYPDSLRWRQALPPLFVIALVGLFFCGFFNKIAAVLWLMMIILYFLALLVGAIPAAIKNKDLSAVIGIPVSAMIMHFSWGAGFLWSFIR